MKRTTVTAVAMSTTFCVPSEQARSAQPPPASATQRVFVAADFGAEPNRDALQTAALQAAVDAAGAAGGGVVRLPAGRFVSGALFLRDGVTLELSEGAVLEGSRDWRDYGAGHWTNALITATALRNVGLRGPGTIDGMGAEREGGEEGFRGPHVFIAAGAEGVRLENLTIRNAGNYAVICRDTHGIVLECVTVQAGHDGLHIQNCENVTVQDCDFRTGDDCIAGTDNRNVSVTGSRFNSSCNAFRLGAFGLTVRDCVFQGPGEFPHKVSVRKGSPRTNMGAAFVHFSPRDRNPQWPSDNWIIERCTIDRVQSVYAYDHERGLWQTGQPAKQLRFADIAATNVGRPIRIVGDAERQLDLTLDNVAITLAPAHAAQPVLDARRFYALRLGRLEFANDGAEPLIALRDGDLIEWRVGPDERIPPDRLRVEEVPRVAETGAHAAATGKGVAP
jgi:hypothetical protein